MKDKHNIYILLLLNLVHPLNLSSYVWVHSPLNLVLVKYPLKPFFLLAIVNITDAVTANDIVGGIIDSMVGGLSGATIRFLPIGVLIGGAIGYKVVRKLLQVRYKINYVFFF